MMANCLFCYQPVDDKEYHSSCSQKFFGIATIPTLELDKEKLNHLAQLTVHERLAVTGVQPKLSLSLNGDKENKRLTIVGLWGEFILKPQSNEFVFMPEVEDLTMHLASLFKIKTAEHALIRTSSNELAYITKRFDRVKGVKVHVEDFCQLSELLTEQKYKSSYERAGKIIKKYATNSGLDALNYFRLVLFSFLTGNNDMHLKNFSLIHTDKGILLSPSYDLLNVNLIFPKDKEDMALTLNGRKSKIKRSDFDQLAFGLGIPEKVLSNIYSAFSSQINSVKALVDGSFLNEQYKNGYIEIVERKFKQIGLA